MSESDPGIGMYGSPVSAKSRIAGDFISAHGWEVEMVR